MPLMRVARIIMMAVVTWCMAVPSHAEVAPPRYKAVAFDYFVIFDPNSVVPEVEKIFPGKGMDVTKAWRAKQFEYGFLRSITGRHEDFFKVTEDALNYTLGNMKLVVTDAQKKQLMNAYLTLKPWPDAVDGLKKLKASGVRIITIANFSERMLRANAENAGITELFDELLSTEVNGTYKPDPAPMPWACSAWDSGRRRLCLPHSAGGMRMAQKISDIQPIGSIVLISRWKSWASGRMAARMIFRGCWISCSGPLNPANDLQDIYIFHLLS